MRSGMVLFPRDLFIRCRRLRLQWMLCAVIWFLLPLTPAMAGDGARFHMAAFHYPPFYWEENGVVEGIGADLVEAVFHRLGEKPVLKLYPLKRALHHMETGDVDGIMILIQTPEREAYSMFTDPAVMVRGLIWSAADRPGGAVEFRTLKDLMPYSMGVTLGYSYGEALDSLISQMRDVESAPSDLQNYRKLLFKRIEIFPGNEIVARGLFKRNPALQGKFVHSKNAFIKWPLRMGVSRKSPLARRIPEINEVLLELKAAGTVDAIVNKYTQ